VSRPQAGVSGDVVEAGERPVKLALAIPSYGSFFPSDRLHEIVGLTRMAEDAGVDTVVVPDHLVMSDRTDRYRWGRFPLPVDAPWLEPLTVLAAIAGATRRVRLATGILIAPLRPAALLAKTAATLDVLSRGRLDLGVGTGWQKEEFDAVQLDYGRRGRLLDDTIAACRALWGRQPGALRLRDDSLREDLVRAQARPARGHPGLVLRNAHPAHPRPRDPARRRMDPHHGRDFRWLGGRCRGAPTWVDGGGPRPDSAQGTRYARGGARRP